MTATVLLGGITTSAFGAPEASFLCALIVNVTGVRSCVVTNVTAPTSARRLLESSVIVQYVVGVYSTQCAAVGALLTDVNGPLADAAMYARGVLPVTAATPGGSILATSLLAPEPMLQSTPFIPGLLDQPWLLEWLAAGAFVNALVANAISFLLLFAARHKVDEKAVVLLNQTLAEFTPPQFYVQSLAGPPSSSSDTVTGASLTQPAGGDDLSSAVPPPLSAPPLPVGPGASQAPASSPVPAPAPASSGALPMGFAASSFVSCMAAVFMFGQW